MHDTSVMLTDNLVDDPGVGIKADSPRSLELTHAHAMCAMRLDLAWESEFARHTDTQVALKLNLWRDIFPPTLESQMMSKPIGHVISQAFETGRLIEGYQQRDCLEIPDRAFNRRFRKGNHIEPRAGRFYPKGFIAGVRGIFPEDLSPFRMARTGDRHTVDLNHPLAQRKLMLTAKILDIWAAGEEHGGACHDIAELVTIGGPGMQARWRGEPTNFWSDIPFIRLAPDADAAFYAKPRFVDHLDATARKQVEALYGRLVPRGGEVLDLMTSWKSHLPEALELQSVAGLGMNREEMEANPQLSERLVHDLNLQPRLPYEDNRFDAVVCTVSVEYLIKPREVFGEVNRVLKPGGRFIVTFSDRWFPPKVVKVWQDMHEFERMGLVLEYFHLAGGFTNLETWSLRGLARPLDDKYVGQIAHSDPVYAVWGEKG
jgi:SAM-dependent methyltransferase